jgi:hypothetical protein
LEIVPEEKRNYSLTVPSSSLKVYKTFGIRRKESSRSGFGEA